MRKSILILSVVFAAFIINLSAFADDGNVWYVDKKGNKHFTCPVMKNEAVVSDNTLYTDYNGVRYYFCCAGCKPTFEKNPDKYIRKMTLPGNIVKVDKKGEYYKCPVTEEMQMVSKDTKYFDYKGKRYYTKSAETRRIMMNNPEKYLGMHEGREDGMMKQDRHKGMNH